VEIEVQEAPTVVIESPHTTTAEISGDSAIGFVVGTLPTLAKEKTLSDGIATISEKVDNIDFTAIAKEETLSQGISEVKNAVANIDLSTVAKEGTLLGTKSLIDGKFGDVFVKFGELTTFIAQKFDWISNFIVTKKDELQQFISDRKLELHNLIAIDILGAINRNHGELLDKTNDVLGKQQAYENNAAARTQDTINVVNSQGSQLGKHLDDNKWALMSKVDELKGENQEATLSVVYDEVKGVKNTVDSMNIPLSAISGLALELESGKKNLVNALNARGIQADKNKDTLTSLADKVYNIQNPYAVTVPAESSNEVANELFNTLMKSQGYDAVYESVYEKFCAEDGSYVGCLMTDINISGATTMNLTGADGYYIYEEDKYYGTDSDGNLTTFLNGSLVQLGTKTHLFDTAITKTKRLVFYLYVDGSTKDGEKDTTRKSSFDYCRNSVIPKIKFSHNSGYFMHFHLKNPELCTISRSENHAASTTQSCIYFYTNAHNIGNCVINYNSNFLYYMDLSNAVTHTGGTLVSNAAVRHLDLSKLQTSSGTLINSCLILESVRLDNLESAGVIIVGSKNIKEFVLPKVKSLTTGAIQSSSFDKLLLPSVERFGGSEGISSGGDACFMSGSAKELYIPNLKNVISSLVLNNATLEELYAPELEYVAANIANGCAKLKKINLPKLTKQDHYSANIYILNNLPKLEEALLPSLTYMRQYQAGGYCMIGLPNLKHLQINSAVFVAQRGDYMFADGKAVNMIWMELSNNPNAAFQIRKWNPTNAYLTDSSSLVEEGEPYANNYEKFIDKFKSGIVDKLTDRTGLGALTMSLNSTLVTKLTDEVKLLVKNKNWNIASV
jgi:hypothetical protein